MLRKIYYIEKSIFLLILYLATLIDSASVKHVIGSTTFIGESTNDFTALMLQNAPNDKSNYVFSPLGYSSVLAILAEGARENTRKQLADLLHLPEDTFAVRQAYKDVLTRMKDKHTTNNPEFKNWFYVYKNYTVEKSYRDVLIENYLTEVRDIDREYYDSTDPSLTNESVTNTPELIAQKNKENLENVPSKNEVDIANVEENSTEKKDDEKISDVAEDKKEVEPIKEEVSSKKPEKIEESQEKVTKLENKVNEESKPVPDNTAENAVETEEKFNSEKEEQEEDHEKKKERIKDNLIGDAIARCFNHKDTITALSANRISSYARSEDNELNPNKKIIIFNGFYYRGNWSKPFTLRDDKVDGNETKPNFCSENGEPIYNVTMLHTEGEFEMGDVLDIESTVIEIPYEGGRYSLLVILPHNGTSVNRVVELLNGFKLQSINRKLEKKYAEVCLPKFDFYTISRAKQALIKCGVTDIFGENSDLSGMNIKKDLYLDELVQLVTMQIDQSDTEINFMTSSLAATRSNVETFEVNRPFLFFLRDRLDNLVIAAGRLSDPTK